MYTTVGVIPGSATDVSAEAYTHGDPPARFRVVRMGDVSVQIQTQEIAEKLLAAANLILADFDAEHVELEAVPA